MISIVAFDHSSTWGWGWENLAGTPCRVWAIQALMMCATASCGWVFTHTHEWRLGICLHHCPPSLILCAGCVFLPETGTFWRFFFFTLCTHTQMTPIGTHRSWKMRLQTSARLIQTSPFNPKGSRFFFFFFFLPLLSQGLSSDPDDHGLWHCVISCYTHTLINAKPLKMWLFCIHLSVRVTHFFLTRLLQPDCQALIRHRWTSEDWW